MAHLGHYEGAQQVDVNILLEVSQALVECWAPMHHSYKHHSS